MAGAWRIRIREEADRSTVDVDLEGVVLGRGTEADVVVAHHGVSRRHARFWVESGRLWVEDLGSANGTRVNGERIANPRSLEHGDLVMLGTVPIDAIEGDGSSPVSEWFEGVEDDPCRDGSDPAPVVRRPPIRRRVEPDYGRWLGVAIFLLALAIGVRFLRRLPSGTDRSDGGGATAAEPRRTPEAARTESDPLAERERSAHIAWNVLEGRIRARPDEIEGHLEAIVRFEREHDGTHAVVEARRERDRLREGMEREAARDYEALERDAAVRIARGDHTGARERLAAYLEGTPPEPYASRAREALAEIDAVQAATVESLPAEIESALAAERFDEARRLSDRFLSLGGDAAQARDFREEADRLEALVRARLDEERRQARIAALRGREFVWREGLAPLPAGDAAARRREFDALAGSLRAEGLLFESATAGAVRDRHEALAEGILRRMRGIPGKLRTEGLRLLASRRAEALGLIEDERRYPHPGGPDKDRVQAEVDRLVAAVRDAYLDSDRPIELLDAVTSDAAAVRELAGYVARMGGAAPDGEAVAWVDLLESAYGNRRVAREILAANERLYARLQRAGELDTEEIACMRTANAYRLLHGRLPMHVDETLLAAAERHSADMVGRDYFSHTNPEREGPGERVRRAGFRGMSGENIAKGRSGGVETLGMWQHSPGHHRNILRESYNAFGVGRVNVTWTMNLGGTFPGR